MSYSEEIDTPENIKAVNGARMGASFGYVAFSLCLAFPYAAFLQHALAAFGKSLSYWQAWCLWVVAINAISLFAARNTPIYLKVRK